MAKKKTAKKKFKKKPPSNGKSTSEPKFPYVANTNSLRQLLRDIPNKPRPPKFTFNVLETWGYTSTNDRPIVSALKKLGFLDSVGVPTNKYDAFMHPATGPAVMGNAIKAVYSPFFVSSHQPDQETTENLKRLFNLHSGGSERTLAFQLQTFKALCEFADFSGAVSTSENSETATDATPTTVTAGLPSGPPSIHVDLHIHLPENKSSRDYEAIIQDIARYIYRMDPNEND